jgi:hypothetical protein
MELGPKSILKYIEIFITEGPINLNNQKHDSFEQIIDYCSKDYPLKIQNTPVKCVHGTAKAYFLKFKNNIFQRINLNNSMCFLNAVNDSRNTQNCKKQILGIPKYIYYELELKQAGIQSYTQSVIRLDFKSVGNTTEYKNYKVHSLIYFKNNSPYLVIPTVKSEKQNILESLKRSLKKNDLKDLYCVGAVLFLDRNLDCDLSILTEIPNILEDDVINVIPPSKSVAVKKSEENKNPESSKQSGYPVNKDNLNQQVELTANLDVTDSSYLAKCFSDFASKRINIYSYNIVHNISAGSIAKKCGSCREPRLYPKYLQACPNCEGVLIY